MKNLITISTALLLTLGALQASAETISHNAAFVTNYVWRGLSQTDNSAAIQAGADYKNKNAYARVWVSNVEDGQGAEGAPLEMDVSFGYNNKFEKFNLDMQITTYNYLHDNTDDRTEFRIATNPIKGLEVALNREIKQKYWYPEVAFEKFLKNRLYLDLSAGFWSFDGGENALSLRAELARDFPEFHHIDLFAALTYISDETVYADDNNSSADSLFLLGIRKRF